MMTHDSFANVVSGLGMFGKDKAAHGTFVLNVMSLHDVTTAYRGDWMARKAVDIPAFDMTRAWRTFQVDKADITLLTDEETRLGIRDKVRKAVTWARLFGGAALVLDDGAPDTSRPLRITGTGGLKSVLVLPKHRCTAGPLCDDLQDPEGIEFGTPSYYSLSGTAWANINLHPSRVIPFVGAEVPDIGTGNGSEFSVYGDSVLVSVRDAILHAAATNQSIASLIEEAKVDIVKIPGLMGKVLNKDFRDQLAERWQLAAVLKSINNLTILDSNEEWESRTQTFTALSDVAQTMLQIVSASVDIPATRFLSQSPKGLNATGDSDLQNYDQMITAKQDTDLGPRMARLDDALYVSALGKKPDGAHSQFNPLRVMTEEQKATLRKSKADTIKLIVDSGLVPTAALEQSVQNMLIEDGWLPGLEAAIEEAEAGALLPFQDPADPTNNIDPTTGQPYPDTHPSSPVFQATQAANQNDPREITVNGGKVAIKAKVQKPSRGSVTKDARARSLYVSRPLLNAAEFITWAKSQGIEQTVGADQLHITIAFSRTAVDWMKVPSDWWSDADGNLIIPAGGARLVEALGDNGAIVLLFSSDALASRHRALEGVGASWDFDGYQPHVTITYQGRSLDLTAIKPFTGKLHFGPEIFEEVVEDWAQGVTES